MPAVCARARAKVICTRQVLLLDHHSPLDERRQLGVRWRRKWERECEGERRRCSVRSSSPTPLHGPFVRLILAVLRRSAPLVSAAANRVPSRLDHRLHARTARTHSGQCLSFLISSLLLVADEAAECECECKCELAARTATAQGQRRTGSKALELLLPPTRELFSHFIASLSLPPATALLSGRQNERLWRKTKVRLCSHSQVQLSLSAPHVCSPKIVPIWPQSLRWWKVALRKALPLCAPVANWRRCRPITCPQRAAGLPLGGAATVGRQMRATKLTRRTCRISSCATIALCSGPREWRPADQLARTRCCSAPECGRGRESSRVGPRLVARASPLGREPCRLAPLEPPSSRSAGPSGARAGFQFQRRSAPLVLRKRRRRPQGQAGGATSEGASRKAPA